MSWSATPAWLLNEELEATALISFFNFSGRLQAASGLPHDELGAVVCLCVEDMLVRLVEMMQEATLG